MERTPHPVFNDSIIKEVGNILRSGLLTGFTATPAGYRGGTYVQKLEQAFKDKFSCKNAVAVNSATAGLHASLLACGIKPGDEVIVSPFSFSSSASCVLMAGATPVFVDIEADTFNMDYRRIFDAISSRTRAIIPVHLCGHAADMGKILPLAKAFKLKVIEDNAQSIGAMYGTLHTGTTGDCGVFSFNQSKHISTGEGGMVVTNDDNLAEKLRAIRNHGEIAAPDLKLLGYNYRLSEIEACLALRQLEELDEMTDHRIRLAEALTDAIIKNFPFIIPPVVRPLHRHVYYTYAMRFLQEERDIFQARMAENGVFFGRSGYVKPLYLLPIYEKFDYKEGLCPVAERMWKSEIMVTDILRYPMSLTAIDEIIAAMRKSMKQETGICP